jgi:NAD-dependent SIR2 family protein deacetylase
MTNEEELFTVYCINCNNQVFKFSMNLLEKEHQIILQCTKCNEDTKVTYDSISGIAIGKY